LFDVEIEVTDKFGSTWDAQVCASAAPNLNDCSLQKTLKIYAAGLGAALRDCDQQGAALKAQPL